MNEKEIISEKAEKDVEKLGENLKKMREEAIAGTQAVSTEMQSTAKAVEGLSTNVKKAGQEIEKSMVLAKNAMNSLKDSSKQGAKEIGGLEKTAVSSMDAMKKAEEFGRNQLMNVVNAGALVDRFTGAKKETEALKKAQELMVAAGIIGNTQLGASTSAVTGAIGAQTVATGGATTAQSVLNKVMSLSPIFWGAALVVNFAVSMGVDEGRKRDVD